MRFSLVAAVLIPVLSAAADDIFVTVGASGQLAFNPSNVSANVGDTVTFQFQSKNHSVTQSTFATPCEIQTTPAQGIDSGFQFVDTTLTTRPEWSFTVDNATTPLWFFCAQTNPVNHCNMGMVFSINANPDSAKSFAVYQDAAKAGGGAPPSSGASPSSGAPPAGGAPSSGESIAASVGDAATSFAASVGDAATSFGASVFGDATSAAGGIGAAATSAGGSIIGDATAGAGSVFSSLLGGGSSPSPTGSAAAAGNSTGAGFRLERSASLPVLAAVGLAGVLLL